MIRGPVAVQVKSVQSHCRIVFAHGHTATSSVRGAALASTCTGSTPQAQAARTCHVKEGGVAVSRHGYGVEDTFCVVVTSWRAMPRPTGGTPRRCSGQAYREWGRMRTRRATSCSSAVRRQAMCQQQPACRPARCWHWGVTGSPNCVSARPQPRQSQVGGAGAWTEAAPGPEPGGPWQLGLLAFSTVDMRGGPGRRRCISFIARGSEGVGRGASARVAPPRCFPTPRCSQSQRPLQLPLLPPRPLPRRLRQALHFQRHHQRGRPPRRSCRGRVAAGGPGRFARGACVAGPSEAVRESSPSSADARASGVAVAAAGMAAGLGATDTTCSGAPGERRGGAAGWASEGCTAEGRGAAAAASPSLDNEVGDVGDGGAPAALPPGAALELFREASDCGIGQGEAVRQGDAGKSGPITPRWKVRTCLRAFLLAAPLRWACRIDSALKRFRIFRGMANQENKESRGLSQPI